MPLARDVSLTGLNECGCCAGIAPETPLRVENRPGLQAVAYRTGTHNQFLESMLAALTSAEHPALRALTTRAPEDLTLAWLDACAAVDDVLSFYQERHANEAYLRTATERVSLTYLAREIGYEPRPGVAANTHLAFTIEDTPGSPEKTWIEAGTRVQSIPGPNELPQTFETAQRIEARAVWNAMRVRTRAPHPLRTDLDTVIVKGIEAGLKRGDSLLIVASDNAADRAVKRVKEVIPDPGSLTTTIKLDAPPQPPPPVATFEIGAMFFGLYSYLTSETMNTAYSGAIYTLGALQASLAYNYVTSSEFAVAANTAQQLPALPPAHGVFALRRRAAIFGHNAPRWASLPQIVKDENRQIAGRHLTTAQKANAQYPDDWDNLKLNQIPNRGTDSIDLDNVYPEMIAESWVVLESPAEAAKAFRVRANRELTRTDFAMSAKVTRLELEGPTDQFSDYAMRDTTVLGQSERLTLAEITLTEDVMGNSVTLAQYYADLAVGQLVIVTGQRKDLLGVEGREVRRLKNVYVDASLEAATTRRKFTRLEFDQPLVYRYDAATVAINANVVEATHGESKTEVLGGGDARQRRQRFQLKHTPLTYTAADNPLGAQATLEFRVNDLLWQEAPRLHGQAADARVYTIHVEDDGRTWVQCNAPLPTGQENVKARYRQGIGLAGLVKADQLTLLATRPLGVRGVGNPLAPSGAQDPERADEIRRNAPHTALTLERLVSLQDYEDFARSFAGFAKARATMTADGQRRGIFVTVAASNGGIVNEASNEYKLLHQAMTRYGDPLMTFRLKSFRLMHFRLAAEIAIDEAFLRDQVLAAVSEKLRQTFSFEARDLGQPVTKSEVIAVIQSVPGVVFVDLNRLERLDAPSADVPARLAAYAPPAGGLSNAMQSAELLMLAPEPPQIGVIAA
jgi:predicted phage baseplate assembly protein